MVAVAGLAVVGAVIGAVGSVAVRHLSNPVSKYRLFYGVVLVPLTLVAVVGLLLLAFDGPLVPLSAAALTALLVGRWLTHRGMAAADNDAAAGRPYRPIAGVK